MTCSDCGTESEVLRRFCGVCGERVRQGCARCGFLNGMTERHCGGCSDVLSTVDAKKQHPRAVPSGPARPGQGEREMLSSSDLEELLHKPVAPAAPALSSKVSQSELDQLFGVGE
jgi:hypothetical protein